MQLQKQIDPSKIQVYWMQEPMSPIPRIHIKYDADGCDVPGELVNKMCFDFEYGKRLHNNHVELLKEAIRFSEMNYTDYERV